MTMQTMHTDGDDDTTTGNFVILASLPVNPTLQAACRCLSECILILLLGSFRHWAAFLPYIDPKQP